MCDRESMACCVRGEKREIVLCPIRLVKRWCVRRTGPCFVLGTASEKGPSAIAAPTRGRWRPSSARSLRSMNEFSGREELERRPTTS